MIKFNLICKKITLEKYKLDGPLYLHDYYMNPMLKNFIRDKRKL